MAAVEQNFWIQIHAHYKIKGIRNGERENWKKDEKIERWEMSMENSTCFVGEE